MDARLKVSVLLLFSLLLADRAYADVFLCAQPGGHRSIQDRPCKGNQKTEARVAENGAASRADVGIKPVARSASKTASAETKPIRNKLLICGLLDTERGEAMAQIGGSAPAPVGENPRDNLVKIERQRSRVGCDAS